MRPTAGPWGGSSPFVQQLMAYLEWRGYQVCFDLRRGADVIVLIDPRADLQNKSFGLEEIERYKSIDPDVQVLHRVNECDQRKATNFMDGLLAEANRVADYTVFISAWLRDYHAQRWFDAARPHGVVYNGADPRVFHPVGVALYRGDGPFRMVTHHWSDNPLKGFAVYQQVDAMIADGLLQDTELWVIGRWPADIGWRAARTIPPLCGADLAARLRDCHAYVTASVWEPCGMHHVEGAQCGLPLIYHKDGGGIVEAGEKYGIGFATDVAQAIVAMRKEHRAYQRRVLEHMPSGDRMCMGYVDIIQRLLWQRGPRSRMASGRH